MDEIYDQQLEPSIYVGSTLKYNVSVLRSYKPAYRRPAFASQLTKRGLKPHLHAQQKTTKPEREGERDMAVSKALLSGEITISWKLNSKQSFGNGNASSRPSRLHVKMSAASTVDDKRKQFNLQKSQEIFKAAKVSIHLSLSLSYKYFQIDKNFCFQ